MAIQPIDLQTLFLKMAQVGRDQAIQKESTVIQQEIQGQEIAKRNQHSDKSVNKTDNLDSGPEKTKEDGKQQLAQEKKEREKEKKNQEDNKEILSDPSLGTNIDISG